MSAFFEGLTSRLSPAFDLIIDLSHATLTSEAIGRIVLLNKKAKANNIWLPRFVIPSGGPIRQLFQVTRLDRVFQVYPTVDAAIDSLR